MEELAMDNYYVYIVTDKNNKLLETGLSGALSLRLRELESEVPADINIDTCKYLLYWESYKDPLQAIARNKEIKKLPKKKKIELINKNNPQWNFLNEDIYEAHKALIIIK